MKLPYRYSNSSNLCRDRSNNSFHRQCTHFLSDVARLQTVVIGGDVGGVTGGSPVAGKQQDCPAVTGLESRTVPLAFYFLGTLDAHRDRTDKGPGGPGSYTVFELRGGYRV